ncbi:MAG: polysaccharide deacetylase family protein [Candidatus Omnitrophica bacterium]|nr:polysaccharide deacetylase family protein [Candidatus Omnitrophota bacterium]
MRNIKKIILAVAVVVLLIYFFFGKFYTVPILMYHNVELIEKREPNWVSPERFKTHLEYIRKHGYEVISLEALVSSIEDNKPAGKKNVVITFDDGHENIFINAYPLLKKYQFPATIFIPSDNIGKDGYLTWGQIREMADNGIEFGSHTRSEKYIPDLNYQDQKDEIFNSKAIIEGRLGKKIDFFAYPIGGFSFQTKDLIKKAGYKGACATNRGFNRFNRDVFALKRIRLSDTDNKSLYLWVKLSGFYNLLKGNKQPF